MANEFKKTTNKRGEDVYSAEGFTLTVGPDNDPINPREHGDCIKIAAWHRDYNLGDAGLGFGRRERGRVVAGSYYQTPMALLESLTGLDAEGMCRAFERKHKREMSDGQIMSELFRRLSATHFWLPLYLYDHSDLSMRCASFGDPWDSGQVGFAFVSKADAAKELENGTEEKAYEQIRFAVETYSDYLSGNVYRWVLRGRDGEFVDSCGSYIGGDADATAEGLEALSEAVADFKVNQAQQGAAVLEMVQAAFAF